METTHVSDAKTKANPAEQRGTIVVDLGKQRRKRVKQLRRGKGRLVEEVNGCLDELRSAGTLSAQAQPVVIVVREKRRRRTGLLPGL